MILTEKLVEVVEVTEGEIPTKEELEGMFLTNTPARKSRTVFILPREE